jgi:hypothetical protein
MGGPSPKGLDPGFGRRRDFGSLRQHQDKRREIPLLGGSRRAGITQGKGSITGGADMRIAIQIASPFYIETPIILTFVANSGAIRILQIFIDNTETYSNSSYAISSYFNRSDSYEKI